MSVVDSEIKLSSSASFIALELNTFLYADFKVLIRKIQELYLTMVSLFLAGTSECHCYWLLMQCWIVMRFELCESWRWSFTSVFSF